MRYPANNIDCTKFCVARLGGFEFTAGVEADYLLRIAIKRLSYWQALLCSQVMCPANAEDR